MGAKVSWALLLCAKGTKRRQPALRNTRTGIPWHVDLFGYGDFGASSLTRLLTAVFRVWSISDGFFCVPTGRPGVDSMPSAKQMGNRHTVI